MSDPSATAIIPDASATAAPPELPPALRPGISAFCVAPKTGLKVWLPRPNSGVFVLPMTIAPASCIRCTMISLVGAIRSFSAGDPIVVGRPAAFDRSLTASGIPCSQPLRGPASAAAASRISASVSRRDTIAFRSGLRAAIRSSVAAIKAVAVRSPLSKAAEMAKAGWSRKSFMTASDTAACPLASGRL